MRAKRVISVFLAAALTVSMATSAFAATALGHKESVYTDRSIYNFGKYPQLSDSAYGSLNKKIEEDLFQTFRKVSPTYSDNIDQQRTSVSFTIEDEDDISVITVKVNVFNSFEFLNSKDGSAKDFTKVYYVDRTEKKELTEAQYKAVVEAKAAAEEEDEEIEEIEEASEEVLFIPLRIYAEALGFVVGWNSAINGVSVSNDDFETFLITGENAYITADGDVVELESAPIIEDGTLLVPVSFFTEILGADVEYDDNGNVDSITLS